MPTGILVPLQTNAFAVQIHSEPWTAPKEGDRTEDY